MILATVSFCLGSCFTEARVAAEGEEQECGVLVDLLERRVCVGSDLSFISLETVFFMYNDWLAADC